uniref:Secreted protein n=1 Tax=Strigamia maritima TaxID=126957 RepID=T1JDM6_STRMM
MISCVIFLLALLAGYSEGQDCVVNSRCPGFVHKVPECKENPRDDDLAKCIYGMLADCHSQVQAAQQMQNAMLANEVICENPDLAEDFKKHKDCWPELQSCKISFGDVRNKVSAASVEEKETICGNTRNALKECKTNPAIPDDCKDMDRKYLDKAFEKSTCGCSTMALQLSVFLVSIMLAAIGRLA